MIILPAKDRRLPPPWPRRVAISRETKVAKLNRRTTLMRGSANAAHIKPMPHMVNNIAGINEALDQLPTSPIPSPAAIETLTILRRIDVLLRMNNLSSQTEISNRSSRYVSKTSTGTNETATENSRLLSRLGINLDEQLSS